MKTDQDMLNEMVTGEALLNAMIAEFIEVTTYFVGHGMTVSAAEAQGRFKTLLHALSILHPDWMPEWAEAWLIETIDERRLARIDD